MVRGMEIIIEQKAYEDLRKLVKKLKEVSDEYKEVKDETLLRILALAFTMNKIREEKIKNKILKEIEELQKINKIRLDRLREVVTDEDYNPLYAHYEEGYGDALIEVEDIIKKAFSGVIEEC